MSLASHPDARGYPAPGKQERRMSKEPTIVGVPALESGTARRSSVEAFLGAEAATKAPWLKLPLSSNQQSKRVRALLESNRVKTVCEESSCPNLSECFCHGTATFMIMGRVCTRDCPFCEIHHGQPLPLDPSEPHRLAEAVRAMDLTYIVLISVNRDDLPDGGAAHSVECIQAVRIARPEITVEIITPDFRGDMDRALDLIAATAPDVLNHNLVTVPRLFGKVRPGASYEASLDLIRRYGQRFPNALTKSGLVLGLGEELDEVRAVMRNLRASGCRMLTIGQYRAPSDNHLPVLRYVTPVEFDGLRAYGEYIGFKHVASGPFVRSSYHTDTQAAGIL